MKSITVNSAQPVVTQGDMSDRFFNIHARSLFGFESVELCTSEQVLIESWPTNRIVHPSFEQYKGPMKANPTGENSSLIVTFCVKSVSLYHFKLAYEILNIAFK